MRSLVRLLIVIASIVTATRLAACKEKGPAERAGENIDKAVEKAGDKIEDAGDKVEDATDPD